MNTIDKEFLRNCTFSREEANAFSEGKMAFPNDATREKYFSIRACLAGLIKQ